YVVEFVKSKDKTRPVTAALNKWYSIDRAFLSICAFVYRSIAIFVKTLDGLRPITAAIATQFDTDQLGQHLDIIGFNRYYGWYTLPGHTEIIKSRLEDEATKWHTKHNKPVFMTEYGADTYAGLHMNPSFVWSEEYQVELLSEHFKAFDVLRSKNFFIGEMIWNFADFKTGQ
ncbi:PREDICTED: beta-glucuronidase-like, partial [Diuraphis noxia]|uniref:beta-glucuronidase-like n=1 Tax=Diuraphis noxia TaxID=143948 RepID=UPI0007639B0F